MVPSEIGLAIGFDPTVASLALSPDENRQLGRILAELALGDEISAEVVEARKDGTLLLDLRGETVRARSEVDLHPGAILNLRVLSRAPQVTLQIVPNQPSELPLTALASPALSSPRELIPLMARLGAIVEALQSLLAGEPTSVGSATAQAPPGGGDRGGAESGSQSQPGLAGSPEPKALVSVHAPSLPGASPPPRPDSPRPSISPLLTGGPTSVRSATAQTAAGNGVRGLSEPPSPPRLVEAPEPKAVRSVRELFPAGASPSPAVDSPRPSIPPLLASETAVFESVAAETRPGGGVGGDAVSEPKSDASLAGSPEPKGLVSVHEPSLPGTPPSPGPDSPRPSIPPAFTPTGAPQKAEHLSPFAETPPAARTLSPSVQANAQGNPRLSTDLGVLVGEARRLPPASPEAGRLIQGLQKALAVSSVDLRTLTPEALRKAIVSLGQPVEHTLLELLDGQGAASGSEIETDLKTALARTVQSPLTDSLPDELKQLAAQAWGRVEAGQALNVLAMAHGQLLFQVAVHGFGEWDLADILVEEDGKRQGDEKNEGVSHLTLQLQPDALGPLRVLVRLKGDEVSCYLACSGPGVAEFVGERLPELRSGLVNQGLQVLALQALVVPNTPEAFGPLKPSRLLTQPLLDALV